MISLIMALGLTGLASAGEVFRVGSIEIESPWARASIGRTRPAAAYFTIRNKGTVPDRLMAVANPSAGMISIHRTKHEGGVMRMSPAGPIEIPPGQSVTLKPGGLHVMMMKLRSPLRKGQTTELELTFERAGKIKVPVPIFGPGAPGPK
jgi:copper(I)-binding protein